MHKALANSVQWINKSKSFTNFSKKNQSQNGFKHSSFKSTCGLMIPIRFTADISFSGPIGNNKSNNSTNSATELPSSLKSFSTLFDNGEQNTKIQTTSDINTFETLFRNLTASDSLDLVDNYYQSMYRDFKLAPNLPIFEIIIDAYSNRGDITKMIEYFREIKLYNLTPNLYIFNKVIKTLAKKGANDRVDRVFHIMSSNGIKGDVVTYNALIDVHGKQGKIEQMKNDYNNMLKQGIKPNQKTYNAILESLSKQGDNNMIFYYMEEMTKNSIKMDLVTYNSIIDSFGKSGDTLNMINIFNKSKEFGIYFNRETFNIMIRWFARIGDTKNMIKYSEQMESNGFEINSYTFHSIMEGISRDNVDISMNFLLNFYWQKMKSLNIIADITTYNYLINSFGRIGDLNSLLDVIHSIRENQVMKNKYTYRNIVEAFIKCNEFENALKYYNQLRHKFKPDGLTISLMIESAAALNRCDVIEVIWEDVKAFQLNVNESVYFSKIFASLRCHQPKIAFQNYLEMNSKMQVNSRRNVINMLSLYSKLYPDANQVEERVLMESLKGTYALTNNEQMKISSFVTNVLEKL